MKKQKHLKNIKLPLALLCAVALSSCATPARPKGEVCSVVGAPYNICACVDSDSGEPTNNYPIDARYDDQPPGCTGYIAISPAYYAELEDYIQDLINRVRGFPRSAAVRSSLRQGLFKTRAVIENSASNAKNIAANGIPAK